MTHRQFNQSLVEAAREMQPGSPAERAIRYRRMPDARVVMVDDRRRHLTNMKMALQCLGFQVEASTAPDAVYREAPAPYPRHYLIDLELDGSGRLEGLNIVEAVRARSPLAFVGVMTAHANRERAVWDRRADFFLDKGSMIDPDGFCDGCRRLAAALMLHEYIVATFGSDPVVGDGVVRNHLERIRLLSDPDFRTLAGSHYVAVSAGRRWGEPQASAEDLVAAFRSENPHDNVLIFEVGGQVTPAPPGWA